MIYFEQDKIFAVKKIGENGDHYDKNRVGGIPGSSPVRQYLGSGRTAFYHTAGYESQNEIDGRGTGIQPF
jgi:hypothetical protein